MVMHACMPQQACCAASVQLFDGRLAKFSLPAQLAGIRVDCSPQISALQVFLLPSVLLDKYLAIWGLFVKRAESGRYQFW